MTYNKAGLSRMNSHETPSEKTFDVRSYTATPSTGAPAELMAREGGLYRRMVELQTEASGWSLAS